MLYPLTFKPILKSLIWGGEKIAPYKGIETDMHAIGESWELSGVSGNESVVDRGPLAGRSITELIAEYKGRLLGEKNYSRFGGQFPLLIKFIDACQDLSIQVHPDDALAAARHNSKGKTEMWYVVDADKGAHLRSGFARKVTPQQYEQSVADNTITDILADYPVHPGDVFFLPAGRVHSIGAGSFIAEIQQTSDITYRIYDFNRVGADGKKRELHTALAKDAIDYTVLDDYRTKYEPARDKEVVLVSCPYFTTSLYDIDKVTEIDMSGYDSFLILICTEGSGRIEDGHGNSVDIKRGHTVLMPACSSLARLIPDKSMKLLASRI